jgi:hypothetical protein
VSAYPPVRPPIFPHFYAARVLSKESRQLVLPGTSCLMTISCANTVNSVVKWSINKLTLCADHE